MRRGKGCNWWMKKTPRKGERRNNGRWIVGVGAKDNNDIYKKTERHRELLCLVSVDYVSLRLLVGLSRIVKWVGAFLYIVPFCGQLGGLCCGLMAFHRSHRSSR